MAAAALVLPVGVASGAVSTFTTPGQSVFTVPAGISTIAIVAQGAQGGGGSANFENQIRCLGGAGAIAKGVMKVTPGQKIYVEVGGAGGDNSNFGGGGGGTNGGGAAASYGGGGGGASDVRTLPAANGLTPTDSRVLIAGGGGGSGAHAYDCTGGNAGAVAGAGTGGNYGSFGGGAGTQTAGGAAGGYRVCTDRNLTLAVAGTRGQGGSAGYENLNMQYASCTYTGGGGGGGRFGGGGGAPTQGGEQGGPGGGAGSSYASTLLTSTSIATSNVVIRPQYGATAAPAAGSVSIDATIVPPTATISSPGNDGSYVPNEKVATSFSCADGTNGSGLASCTDSTGKTGVGGTISGSLDTSKIGTFTYTVTATSKTGLTGKASITYTVAGPPTAQVISPGGGGTYKVGEAVSTSFSCDEGPYGPGLEVCRDSQGTNGPGSGSLDTTTTGPHTYTVTSTSYSGLTGTASISYTVAAAPSATISAPAPGGVYAIGQKVATAFSCAEGASGPGISTCRDGANAASPGVLDTAAAGPHTYTVTATSKDGQTATKSIAYSVAAGPTATIAKPLSGAYFAIGEQVATQFTCQDGANGPGIATCLDGAGATSPGVLDTAAKGVHTYTVTAISKSGQKSTTSRTYSVVEPPKATITAPADGGLYAVGATVSTAFTCTDSAGAPGITSCRDAAGATSPGALNTAATGTFTYTVTATSGSGQTATTSINYTVAAAPTATIKAPDGGGLYALGQTVGTSFTCAEGASGPGLESCLDGAGASSPGVLDTTTAGDHTYVVKATSSGGQTTSVSIPYVVAAPPTVSISAPEAGKTYVVGARVATAFSCDEGVGGPGLKSCLDGAGSSGVGFLDTESAGDRTYVVTATSKDGQSASKSVAYTVAPAGGAAGAGGSGGAAGAGAGSGDSAGGAAAGGSTGSGSGGASGGSGSASGGSGNTQLPTSGTTAPPTGFALLSAVGSKKKKTIAVSVRVPGAGRVSVTAPGYRTVAATVKASGTKLLKLVPTAKTKAALARSKHPKVKLTVSFKPASGAKKTLKATVRF